MEPVQGTVEIDVPITTLWNCFARPDYWPRWNHCFFWVRNRDLRLGRQLIWAFEPIKPRYLYKLWSIARIVELEPFRKVTWEVTAFPGMYARHTYHVEDLGGGRTRFGSWEKAMGPGFRWIRRFWLAHFTFVKDASLQGALALSAVYGKNRRLDPETLPRRSYAGFALGAVAFAVLLLAAVAWGWFYMSFVRETAVRLAPDVHAVFGGGGNSLVLESAGQVLLVDTKFPPGSEWLQRWLTRNVRAPVTTIVNTHYHYDHTQGNSLYPNALKVARAEVPALMRAFDADWWGSHAAGVPSRTVPDSGMELRIGSERVLLRPVPPAHTRGDLVVVLPERGIVATGDLVFNRYYPFMDQPEGGTTMAGMSALVRGLATEFPSARFLPGHGPMATAADLHRYADFLDTLRAASIRAHRAGWNENRAVAKTDLSRWKLSVLPSFHHRRLIWATASNDVRWAYRLVGLGREGAP
jgi:glyoxylase-like metal-dependent hydrolase (beta-lactamase superfamily II)